MYFDLHMQERIIDSCYLNSSQYFTRKHKHVYVICKRSTESDCCIMADCSLETRSWNERVWFRLTGRTTDCSNALFSHDTCARGRVTHQPSLNEIQTKPWKTPDSNPKHSFAFYVKRFICRHFIWMDQPDREPSFINWHICILACMFFRRFVCLSVCLSGWKFTHNSRMRLRTEACWFSNRSNKHACKVRTSPSAFSFRGVKTSIFLEY